MNNDELNKIIENAHKIDTKDKEYVITSDVSLSEFQNSIVLGVNKEHQILFIKNALTNVIVSIKLDDLLKVMKLAEE